MRRDVRWLGLLVAALTVAAWPPGDAATGDGEPGVDERLGQPLPSPLLVTDEQERRVPLFAPANAGQPTVLVPAYYHCPQLCGLVLEAVLHAAKEIDWSPGRDYRLVTVSFDDSDRPAQARQKQQAVLAGAGGDARFTPACWPFMSADADAIARLLAALGEHVRRQDDGTISHPAVAVVLTPQGTIARYLYGIVLRPLDLKLALLEASAGRVLPSSDRALLFCYRYDPATRRYGLFIARFLQWGSLATALGGAVGIALLVRWTARRRRAEGATAGER